MGNRPYIRPIIFTLMSQGTAHTFKPQRTAVDFNDKDRLKTLLEIHSEYVRMRNRPDVFILDNHGKRFTV